MNFSAIKEKINIMKRLKMVKEKVYFEQSHPNVLLELVYEDKPHANHWKAGIIGVEFRTSSRILSVHLPFVAIPLKDNSIMQT